LAGLNSRKRDQQKWNPVLRPVALQIFKWRMDLIAKPLALWRIMRAGVAS
jgi:hypothetical protein